MLESPIMTPFSRGKIGDLLHAMKPAKPVEVPEASYYCPRCRQSFSVLYEKIRNAVDYKDDHLFRKAAIARILKRLLVLEPIRKLLQNRSSVK